MRSIARGIADTLLVASLLLLAPCMQCALAEGTRSTEGTAYAVVTDDGRLVFLRSAEEYEEGGGQQVRPVTDITGRTWQATRVYAGIEEAVFPDELSAPWSRDWREITSFGVADGCLVRPASCAYLLCNLHNMRSAVLAGLDTGGVTDMRGMFRFDKALTSVDLTGIDGSCVTSMEGMFEGCESLPGIDVSPLETSSATNMRRMFFGCASLERLDLSTFDTSHVARP